MGKTRLRATTTALLYTSIIAHNGWHLGKATHPVSITIDLIVIAAMAWGLSFFMRAAYEERP